MKRIILITAVLLSSFYGFSQHCCTFNEKENNLLFKVSPIFYDQQTNSFLETVNAGIEYKIKKRQSVELETTIRNLIAKHTSFGYTKYDFNKYYDFSFRYKYFFYQKDRLRKNSTFNGSYLAGGFINRAKGQHLNSMSYNGSGIRLDVGVMKTFYSCIVTEAYVGISGNVKNMEGTQRYFILPRLGFRIGFNAK